MSDGLIDSNGHPVPEWMALMLSDADRAVIRGGDTFWADMRARTTILLADIQKAEAEADQLILDLTRASMAAEQ